MEYALGSIITLAIILVATFFIRKKPVDFTTQIRYSQSHIHRLIAPFMPSNYQMKSMPITQATTHYKTITTLIVFMEKQAYWIKENKLYVADVLNNEIQHNTESEVDTMSMDKVELDKIMLVVEKLTKGMN